MRNKYDFDFSEWYKAIENIQKSPEKKQVDDVFIDKSFEYKINSFKAKDDIFGNEQFITNENIKIQPYIDKKIIKKFNNNNLAIDRSLDLHNFTEKEARLKFYHFIKESYLKTCKYLLVITGKGNNKKVDYINDSLNPDYAVNQGVLYRSFFHWVEDEELKNYILSYSHANKKHGGSGAFYVVIKTNKLLKNNNVY